jgi:hypothetical protein
MTRSRDVMMVSGVGYIWIVGFMKKVTKRPPSNDGPSIVWEQLCLDGDDAEIEPYMQKSQIATSRKDQEDSQLPSYTTYPSTHSLTHSLYAARICL